MADYGFSINVSGNSIPQLKAIEAELQKLGVQAATTSAQVSDSFTRMGSNVTSILSSIAAASGIAFGVAGIANFGRQVLYAGTTIENAQTGLATLLKSAEEARIVIANTQKDAMATPFEFEGLLAANKALISANVNAVAARKTVLDLANAVAATGGTDDELTRMIVNLQQIKNTGRATAIDIRQFAYAGINIYEALAEATGKSISEVKGLSVTYDMVAFALAKAHAAGGIYANGLENMAQNTSVQISNLGDKVFNLANSMFVDLKPAITEIINTFSDWLDTAKDVWRWLVIHKDGVSQVVYALKVLAGALLIYKGYLISVAIYTRALAIAEAFLGVSMTATTAATVANTAAMAANRVAVTGFGSAMTGVATATNAATTATAGLSAAWAGLGVGALLIGLSALVNKLMQYNGEIEKSIEKVSHLKEHTNTFEDINDSFNRLNNKFEVLPKLSIATRHGMFDEIQAEKKRIENEIVSTQADLAAAKKQERQANRILGVTYESQGQGQHVRVVQYGVQDANKRSEITNSVKTLSGNLAELSKKMERYNKGLNILAENGITKGITGVSTNPAGDAAYNTSQLSGASGGLGQAKQIHITFNGPFQQNNGVKESKDEADQAIQKMIEAINGFSDSQNSQ